MNNKILIEAARRAEKTLDSKRLSAFNPSGNIATVGKHTGSLNTAEPPTDARLRPSEMIAEKDAADVLGIAPGTLSVWRSTGRYALPFVKIGSRVRYRRSDLQAWLDSRVRVNGATG